MSGGDRTAVVRMRAEFDQAIRQWDLLTAATERNARAQREATRQMNLAGDDAGRTAARLGRAGSAWQTYGRLAAAAIAGIQVKNLIRDAVALEAQFSKTMAQVAVQVKAPAGEVKRLDDLALKLGADTVFSANDAATAMLSLAKGGLSVAQIEAGALADTLTLAAAGEMELGQAADVVVAAMGSFQLGAKDTDTAVAALAGGANASSASLQDMSMALSQTGTSANAAHFSIAETTAFLAAFADQGFKGSDAGTSLRTMLSRLVPQTKEAQQAADALGLSYVDSNGRLVSATEIAARTQKAFKGLSDEERSRAVNTIFGADAQRAVNALVVEGESGIRKYLKSTTDLTQAQKLAEAANSGTAGALEELSGAAETALIKVGRGLAPTIQDLAGKATSLLESGDLETWAADAGQAVSDLVDEVGPLASELLEAGQNALPVVEDAAKGAAAGLGLVLEVVKPIIGLFNEMPESAQQALILAGGMKLLSGRMEVAGDRVTRLRDRFKDADKQASLMRGGIGLAGAGLMTLGSEAEDSDKLLSGLLTTAGLAAAGFATAGPIGAAIGGGAGALMLLADATGHSADEFEKGVGPASDYAATLDDVTGAATKATRALVFENLGKADILNQAADLKIQSRDLVDYVLGSQDAIGRVNKILEDNAFSNTRSVAEVRNALRVMSGDFEKNAQDAEAARQASMNWDEALKGIPKDVRARLENENYDVTLQEIADLGREYKLTPKQVRTLVEVLGRAESEANIRAVVRAAKAADGTKASIVITTTERTYREVIKRPDRSDVGAPARNLEDLFRGRADGGIDFYADGGVGRSAWSDMNFFASGGMHALQADMLANAGDRVASSASRRENHVAQIAPAGSWRVWAEDETGGEAYIPLAPAKRPRSMEIWRQTGRLLGATEMDFYANGKIRGHSLDYWEEKRASRLELARMQQRITELQRSLRETEKYGRGNKRSRRRLRGIDRTVAELELRDARKELEEARFANTLNRSRSGTIQQRINQRDGAGQRAQDAESTRAANDVLARARRAGLNPDETAAALTAQQGVLDAQRRLREAKKGTLEYRVAETEVAKAKTELNDVLTRADAKKTELEQANEEAEQAQQQRQQASESFARNGAISRWSSAGAASRSTDRSIADMGTFIDLLVQLRGKGAPRWLLDQLNEHGPSREAIRVAKQYLGSPELLARANVQAAQIQALSGAYGALTSNTAWWPGTTVSAANQAAAGTQRLEVDIKTNDPAAIAREVQRVVRHEISVMIVGSGI